MSVPTKNVLVVDDEESMRYVVALQLNHLGYECVTASSGEEALEKLGIQSFDLMMLDILMPGLSGLDVLSKARSDYPNICIVMLSALVDVLVAGEAIKRGADDYITKPFQRFVLETRLQRALERRELAVVDQLYPFRRHDTAREQELLRDISGDLNNDQMSAHELLPSSSGR